MTDCTSRIPDLICFGDSLTVGYQSPTSAWPAYRETPYGKFLQDRLGESYHVVVRGVSGEMTGEMVERFSLDVLDHPPHSVVILGGTNDLGCQIPIHDILNNLIGLYQQAQTRGVHPIAVTIPSIRISRDGGEEELGFTQSDHVLEQAVVQPQIERRIELNRLLADHCSSTGIPCVDLFSATADSNNQQLAAPFSNDGLHLSTRGYEVLAELLWDQVFQSRLNNSDCSG